MSTETKLEPVKKQVEVSLNQESTFRLFTDQIGKWWPLGTCSVGLELAETCHFEGKPAGLVTIKDGILFLHNTLLQRRMRNRPRLGLLRFQLLVD